jgi:hypothetical protein
MPNHCILIIDPQKDFIHVDGIYAKRHAGITQMLQAKTKINELLQAVEPTSVRNLRLFNFGYDSKRTTQTHTTTVI